jgi:hypothetical protein
LGERWLLRRSAANIWPGAAPARAGRRLLAIYCAAVHEVAYCCRRCLLLSLAELLEARRARPGGYVLIWRDRRAPLVLLLLITGGAHRDGGQRRPRAQRAAGDRRLTRHAGAALTCCHSCNHRGGLGARWQHRPRVGLGHLVVNAVEDIAANLQTRTNYEFDKTCAGGFIWGGQIEVYRPTRQIVRLGPRSDDLRA